MACYHPTPAHQKGPGQPVTLWPQLGTENLAIPCGKCVGCLANRANQWAHRCQHEASQYDHNIFVTLTYDDDSLPTAGHLNSDDLTRFIKRLRKRATTNPTDFTRDRTRNIRYFACGEYGEHTGRPHYHAIFFNCQFSTSEKIGTERFTSDTLHTLWPHGLSDFGIATTAGAHYIAKYNLKQLQYKRPPNWMDETDGYITEDGEWISRPSPFLRMSFKPPIGTTWLKNFSTDLRHGYLLENSAKHAIPRAYKKQLEKTARGTVILDDIKRNLRVRTPSESELRAQEIIHKRLKQLAEKRGM